MIDLPGFLLSLAAVVLTIVAAVIEVLSAPRRLDWKEYLAFQVSFALFFAFVSLMYLASYMPRFDRPEVFGVLRTLAFGINPLVGLSLLLLLARYDLVSPRFRHTLVLPVPPLVLASAALLGMLLLENAFVGFIGILGGRIYLLAVTIALTASAYSRESQRIGRALAAFLGYWLGLTAIEVFLDFVPDAIRALTVWYMLGAILHAVLTVVSILRRRGRVTRAGACFARSMDEPATGEGASGGAPQADRSVPTSPPGLLTARDVEIARAIADGETYREIAERFRLSDGMAKTGIYRVYRTLGIHDRIELKQVIAQSGAPAEDPF